MNLCPPLAYIKYGIPFAECQSYRMATCRLIGLDSCPFLVILLAIFQGGGLVIGDISHFNLCLSVTLTLTFISEPKLITNVNNNR